MSFKLPKLQSLMAIVDKNGLPTLKFMRWWNTDVAGAIEKQETRQDDQQATIIRSLRALSHTDGAFIAGVANGATAKATITAHTRNYLDTVVSVDAGEVTGLDYGKTYSVFYDDPERDGGDVTYMATLTASDAVTSVAHPYRDLVGVVTTPATSGSPPTDGGTTTPPGFPPAYNYEEP